MSTGTTNDVRASLNERSGFHVWWRLLRPHTLTASFVPVFVGTMFAVIHKEGTIALGLFAAMLIASILIQAATNMFNEYYDYVRGLDTEESVGIGGTIVRDGIHPKTVLYLALSFFAIAVLLGVYICMLTSWWIALIGSASMLVGYLYTGGPLPIAYTPFGELVAGFFMGPVIIGIAYYIQTEVVTWAVFGISIPVAICIGAIMMANNIRDRVGDETNGRRTLAILLGHEGAVTFLAANFIIVYLLTIIYIITGLLPWWSLLTLLSAVHAQKAVRSFSGKKTPVDMMPAMKGTAQTNTFYGVLLGLSLLISLI
ncbi:MULTISPECIES: 1,4-dihydroxy-2-naphthoate polyprenyltransferase [Salimicrobium]|uniref:1,4-dihydroxy-2-naphthoate octaprenyltransferase n=2 Tax=Salimicrobium TaxID=351195 RepID=A0ABY1KSV9_9BACI|nr:MULTISPECIES: 1,4-dihydroxy-2-naphthoate polyprenyltransferase [Salimicrobium]SDY02850.1 1,4-dihydroxy-2-naphthoate prenyltransferase [Salimicrobium album]SIS72764.1 1,4-dihydroxy-2-naphthoate prenyltransferase [Salimicrobium salexigens]